MENKDDKILKDFFAENKKEIEDFGFSRRVMEKLPEKREVRWILPLLTFIGVIITLSVINVQELIMRTYIFIGQIPIIYLALFSFIIPFICLAFWYSNEKKHRIFI